MGRVKLSVPSEAASYLVGPVMATFLERYRMAPVGPTLHSAKPQG